MVSEEIKKYIIKELHRIEKDFQVRILYAVESGSRAWGFSNKESDYDIRFIYVQPLREYLSISNGRDVIDYTDLKDYEYKYPLDFSGWDISKALKLHYKNNPSLNEYIKSDLIYLGDNSFFKKLPSFNKETLKQHYYHMTLGMYNKYIKGKNEVTLRVVKTYCYCIRQLLCYSLLKYISVDELPINTYSLIEYTKNNILIENKLLDSFYDLLNYYRCNTNTNINPQTMPLIDAWINKVLQIIQEEDNNTTDNEGKDLSSYDKRFRNILYQSHYYGDDLYTRCDECINSNGMFLDEIEGGDAWCKLGHHFGFGGCLYCNDYLNEKMEGL